MPSLNRHSSVFRASMAAFCLLIGGAARADGPASAPTDAFAARLKAINAKSAHVADLKAEFVQEKKSPLLRKPIVSRGTVAAKGAKSLWQTVSPQPSSMASDPRTLRLYFPDRKVVEEYPIRSQLGVMAASPLPSLETLEKSFTLAPDSGEGLADADSPKDCLAVRVTPKEDQVKQYVDHVRVLLDPARGLVLAFEMTDPDGEVTLIRFANIQTDTGLPDSAVELNLPADVKTVHPLGDTGAAQP